jgi:hypothetical protein
VAEYFHLNYEGLLDKIKEEDDKWDWYADKGKVYCFTDPNNGNATFYIFEECLNTENLRLESDGFKEYMSEEFENMTEEERINEIESASYPLKQFFKDYDDLPQNVKESIGIVRLGDTDTRRNVSGDCTACLVKGKEGRGEINLFQMTFNGGGDGSNPIHSNVRTVFYHELGHSYAHKLEYENKWGWHWETGSDYMAKNKKYTNAKKEDKKLNGDKWATAYGQSTNKNSEECADVTKAVLLNATKDKDPNYSQYRIELSFTEDRYLSKDRYVSVDEFIEKYPNRVKAVKEMMNVE